MHIVCRLVNGQRQVVATLNDLQAALALLQQTPPPCWMESPPPGMPTDPWADPDLPIR